MAEKGKPVFITVYDIVKAHGGKEVDGHMNGDEFIRLGFEFLGGCKHCGASIAAYNAYPTKLGYWACVDCVGDAGFATVKDFEVCEKERLKSEYYDYMLNDLKYTKEQAEYISNTLANTYEAVKLGLLNQPDVLKINRAIFQAFQEHTGKE